MTALRANTPVGLLLRLLMVAVCALPFATPRKLATALNLSPPSLASSSQLPSSPLNEEDESEREEDVKARESSVRPDRRDDLSRQRTDCGRLNFSPKKRLARLSHFSHLRPTAADPFCNGLGTPIRC